MIKLSKKEVLNTLLNKQPYVYVDEANIIPDLEADGVKFFSEKEFFFKAHFPQFPVVPGVIQLEAIMQTAALVIYKSKDYSGDLIMAKKFQNVEIYYPVKPNDTLYTKIKIISNKRGLIKAKGYAYLMIDKKKIITCRAEFCMIMPNVITLFLPKGV